MEALTLKIKTDGLLAQKGIPVNEYLPKIEEITELSFTPVENIRKRAVALSYVLARAFGAPFGLVHDSIKKYSLGNLFSPRELDFINQPNPPKEHSQQFQINVEALWELAWVLGLIPKVSHWGFCENNLVHLIPKPGDDPSEFLDSSQMRGQEAIYEETDLLFRIHWASRDAYLKGLPEPTGLPEYVIDQRHKAINWVSFGEGLWDEVDTST